MVTVLKAYDQVSDADAVVATRVDGRWQLVLGSLGTTDTLFSQGVLVKFRERMIAHDLDQKLLDRTVALAKQTGRFGWQALRATLDSSPLVGAGRVEDTWNLLGRALQAVVMCAATTLKLPRDQVLHGAGVTLLGAPSLKAALDIDWTDLSIPRTARPTLASPGGSRAASMRSPGEYLVRRASAIWSSSAQRP
jgi:hypothetical protein